MVTIEGLKQYGADVESGLKRCMNNEGFYLKLVQKAVDECEGMYGKLEAAPDGKAAGSVVVSGAQESDMETLMRLLQKPEMAQMLKQLVGRLD